MKIIVEEEGRRSEVCVGDRSVSVGRAPDNGVRLQSTRVSRHHCRIEFEGQGGWVTDLGSANGLSVNGERVQRAFLRSGDELELGGARLVLEPEPGAEDTADQALRTQLETQGAGVGGAAALARVVATAVAGAPLEECLSRLVDEAVEQLEAERGFLVLARAEAADLPRAVAALHGAEAGDRDGAALADHVFAVARNFDRTDVVQPDTRVSRRILLDGLGGRRVVRVVDAAEDPRLSARESIEGQKLRSVVCAPVSLAGHTVGALYLDNRLAAGAFDDSSEPRLAAFASFAALLVQRARLEREQAVLLRERDELRARLEAMGAERTEPVEASARTAGRSYEHILGKSAAMQRVFEVLDRVVECELPVLIRGESGTGKELIARAIHTHGARAGGPFISENCAALPDSLLESELFGHARGAFTGAERAKKGLIEQASGGTLFLDEIGDMSPEMQKKLLRVLQEGEVRPLGSDQRVSVDVRLVAASHRDLAEMVAKGEFRQDLYYRVNVLELELPPLRARREDVPLLARALLERACTEVGRTPPAFTREALDLLCAYHWPGNVRELENEMRRLAVLGSEAVLPDQVSPQIRDPQRPPSRSAELFDAVGGDLRQAVADFEHRAIQAALAKHDGNKSRAASELGLSRFALQRKLEKYEASAQQASRPQGDPAGDGTAAAGPV